MAATPETIQSSTEVTVDRDERLSDETPDATACERDKHRNSEPGKNGPDNSATATA